MAVGPLSERDQPVQLVAIMGRIGYPPIGHVTECTPDTAADRGHRTDFRMRKSGAPATPLTTSSKLTLERIATPFHCISAWRSNLVAATDFPAPVDHADLRGCWCTEGAKLPSHFVDKRLRWAAVDPHPDRSGDLLLDNPEEAGVGPANMTVPATASASASTIAESSVVIASSQIEPVLARMLRWSSGGQSRRLALTTVVEAPSSADP
jgi:hypothetical protein